MREVTMEQIRSRALALNEEGIDWHFHILTPLCIFNQKKKYAVILENLGNNWVHYSEKKPSELGRELAPLMHKASVLDQATTDEDYRPTVAVKQMVSRAEKLNAAGVEWHHHVLPRSCKFNEDSANFTLVFEDPKIGVIKQSSDIEPINDLKQIEPLFYNQRS